ncbi:MAG: hypothetical protein HC805_03680 [Alkalinema sp. RL_2_19]|nr:hypothetical protein [Alkalinema sp. RL_2_19]
MLVDNTQLPTEVAKGGMGQLQILVKNLPSWARNVQQALEQRQASKQSLQLTYKNGNRLTAAKCLGRSISWCHHANGRPLSGTKLRQRFHFARSTTPKG